MAANLQQAAQEAANTHNLVGDLVSTPDPTRRLVTQDVYSLEWAAGYAGPYEAKMVRDLIREKLDVVEAELQHPRSQIITDIIKHKVSHQLRCRLDMELDCLAVEQWVPALRAWIVNGYFPHQEDVNIIVSKLQAGDPRFKTAEEALAETREIASENRAANEAAGDTKVAAAIDKLGSKGIEQFIAVEEALQTGDKVTLHGDDERLVQGMFDQTRTAAARGDLHAQDVLTHGVRDDQSCALPTTNPLRHRHRAELERAQGGTTHG